MDPPVPVEDIRPHGLDKFAACGKGKWDGVTRHALALQNHHCSNHKAAPFISMNTALAVPSLHERAAGE